MEFQRNLSEFLGDLQAIQCSGFQEAFVQTTSLAHFPVRIKGMTGGSSRSGTATNSLSLCQSLPSKDSLTHHFLKKEAHRQQTCKMVCLVHFCFAFSFLNGGVTLCQREILVQRGECLKCQETMWEALKILQPFSLPIVVLFLPENFLTRKTARNRQSAPKSAHEGALQNPGASESREGAYRGCP